MPNATSAGAAGTLARVVVAACFVGGAVFGVTGRLVLAGTAFLVGHTLLATAAVAQGQRRRGVGLSLSGIGWLALSIGLSAAGGSAGAGPAGVESLETPLLAGGLTLVTVGTLLVLGALDGTRRGGGGEDEGLEERA